ncbi:MAG: hypothetical protein VKK59_00365, partial [Vampirovibrionales bacterium]|nr:hypothetical protein [Vampirovibrionales bacterium]
LASMGWLTPNQVQTLRQIPTFDLTEHNTLGPVKGQVKLRYYIKPLPWQKPAANPSPKTSVLA